MAHASAKIAAISLVATLRPTTSPLTARAAGTPRPSPGTTRPSPAKTDTSTLPRATAAKPKGAPKATKGPKAKSTASAAYTAASAAIKKSRIWSLPIFKRGRLLEKLFGGNLAHNFPIIDRWANGIATSIKSLDLGAKSYQNVGRLTSRVRGYINKVAKFNGKSWGEREILASQIKGRALIVAIPHTGTPAQQAALAELLKYGREVGVDVTFVVVP